MITSCHYATQVASNLGHPAELACFGKPEDGMHMIRHREKSNTLCRLPFHLRIQMAEQNSFGLIMVKDLLSLRDPGCKQPGPPRVNPIANSKCCI